jgi:NDP-sugar pyrophosphorylase family protein
MKVAILAGGLATRLRPITENIPKALVEVAGRPFIDHQIELLVSQELREIVMCVGYLGEMIEGYLGDGSRLGARVTYSSDGDQLIGTGGALRKALPLLGEEFFVLYGDSYLPIDYGAVKTAYRCSGKSALMTIFRNDDNWDKSNVIFENGEIQRYSKCIRSSEMKYIDYGLEILSQKAFVQTPVSGRFDLADLLSDLVSSRNVAGYEVKNRFYEIGSPAGLDELNSFLENSNS